jgi:hypothetical protein
LDGQDDIPFGPAPADENLPLVVPIQPKARCSATTKAGKPCPGYPMKGQTICLGHYVKANPQKHAEWIEKGGRTHRFSKLMRPSHLAKPLTQKDLLAVMAQRLNRFVERFGETSGIDVEECICEMVKTIATVMKLEGKEDTSVGGWRMKGVS